MFDSGISAGSLISELKDEIDVAIPISNKSYVESLNSLEQLLYTEIIKEQKEYMLTMVFNVVALDEIAVASDEKVVTAEDVHAVYLFIVPKRFLQLKKTTLATSKFIKNSWFIKDRYDIAIEPSDSVEIDHDLIGNNTKVVYFVRPALKTVNSSDVVGSGNVMLPVEFIDLAKAKLRADAYKIANEDSLAAKWMNDYNILLETFKEWIERKRPHFGM